MPPDRPVLDDQESSKLHRKTRHWTYRVIAPTRCDQEQNLGWVPFIIVAVVASLWIVAGLLLIW